MLLDFLPSSFAGSGLEVWSHGSFWSREDNGASHLVTVCIEGALQEQMANVKGSTVVPAHTIA